MAGGAPCTARSTGQGIWSTRGCARPATGTRRSAIFRRARALAGATPEQVTTDGHDAYPRAIRATRGDGVAHRCSRYKNNRSAHDHRGLQQRYHPMRGFGSFAAAARCCTGVEAQRQSFRAQARSGAFVSLAERRRRFQDRGAAVLAALTAACWAVSAASPRPAHSRAASAVPILTQPF